MKYFVLFFFPYFLIQCGDTGNLADTEIGNPERVAIQVVGFDSSNARFKIASLSSGVTLTEARLSINEIEFRPFSACQDSNQKPSDIHFEGPYVVDLLMNKAIPDFGIAEIPSGVYCKVEFELKKLDKDEIPSGVSSNDSLIGKSLQVKGTRLDGVPFDITLEVKEQFKLVNKGTGFEIRPNEGLKQFFVAFDFAAWFDGVDLTQADVFQGTILINSDYNQDLHSILVRNIKTSGRLFEDQNRNGILDLTERSSSSILGEGEDS